MAVIMTGGRERFADVPDCTEMRVRLYRFALYFGVKFCYQIQM